MVTYQQDIILTKEKKMARTWNNYWASDSSVITLQNKASEIKLEVEGLNDLRKKSDDNYNGIRRKVLAAYHNLVDIVDSNGTHEYTIYDRVNSNKIQHVKEGTFRLILESPELDNSNNLTDEQKALRDSYIPNREILENNIKYYEKNFFTRFLIICRRFWHGYHSQPLKSTVITSIFVAALLYLQSGLLNFTPISSILLFSTLFLTFFLLSSTLYVKTFKLLKMIANDGSENNPEENPDKSSTSKVISSMCCNPRFQLTALLWLTVVTSVSYFFVATLNSFAYSMFLTPTATSFLLFPTTLWGCFAVAILSSIILYTITAVYFKSKESDLTEKQLESSDSYNFFGVKCEHKTVTELLTESTAYAINSASALTSGGINLITDTVKPEAKAITNAAKHAARNVTGGSDLTIDNNVATNSNI